MKLIIAEKHSVAAELAKIVGANKRENGYYSGSGYLVSWCVGHLVELAEPDAYDPGLKKWSLDTLPIIPERYKTAVSGRTADQFNILKGLMNRTDVAELVEATDAGREGELIYRLVYEKAGCKKPFKRLWISSMEAKSIRHGLDNMKDGREYDNLYKSALCRQRADWLMGINLTRMYSLIYNNTLKTGRVQTPAINLIVKRQREISSFVPKLYYNLTAGFESFKAFNKTEDKELAIDMVQRFTGKEAVVVNVDKQNKSDNPPAPYDLTSLQRDANRLLGYSAQQTLDTAQKLYEAKMITYPRTDSRYITADMENTAGELITSLTVHGICGNGVTAGYDTQKVNIKRIIDDSKVTDHHALLPTGSVTKEKLDGLSQDERNIFFLVAFRLLSSVYAAHSYKSTKVTLDIDGFEFTASGKEITENGYITIEGYLREILCLNLKKNTKSDEAIVLPAIAKDDKFTVQNITSEEKKTQPPKSYTEDTLLLAMETCGKDMEDAGLKEIMKGRGLGTPATRAGIIENIISSGYVTRSGKKLLPTETACKFMDIVTDKVKEPELTAEWEKQLSDVNNGNMTDTEFMDGITGFLRSFVNETKTSGQKAGIFPSGRECLGICPKCGENVVEYTKSYSCQSGKSGCGFVIWKQIAGKSLSKTQAVKLLANRKTDLIKGFTSKSGKPFDAYVVLKGDFTTGFAFQKGK